MNERCDGWLSKTHPPKSLVKRSAVVKQKGPLSRSTPPRAMLMNKSRLNLYASYLTQNSPPPPQLMLATKQSTLGDYFGPKGDKGTPRIQGMPVPAKDIASSSISCHAEEFRHEEPLQTTAENKHQIYDETSQPFQMTAENKHQIYDETSQPFQMTAENKHQIYDETSQPFQMTAENKHQIYDETSQPFQMTAENKHQIYDETSLIHSQYQSHTSDLPLTMHNSNILEKHMNSYGRDRVHFRQAPRTYQKLDSAVSSSGKYFRSVDCICSKENCLQGCKSECLFCSGPSKGSVISSGVEPKPGQGHVCQVLRDRNSSRQADEFVTFSEGMKLLSQMHTETDNFSHSQPSCPSHVWSEEDECFLSGHTVSASLEGLSDSQGLHCVTQDASRQYVHISCSSSEGKVTHESFADSQDISSLHTIRKRTRSPECVDEDTNIGELEKSARVNNSIEFTLPHSSDNEINCTRDGTLQDCETPDFADTAFTVSIADTVNGTKSIRSQLLVLGDEQFQKRKAQYMSDFGTLVLSENI